MQCIDVKKNYHEYAFQHMTEETRLVQRNINFLAL